MLRRLPVSLSIGLAATVLIAGLRDVVGDAPVAYLRQIDLGADISWVAARMPSELTSSFFESEGHRGWRMDGSKWVWNRIGGEFTVFRVYRRNESRVDRTPAGTATVERTRQGWPFTALEGDVWRPGTQPAVTRGAVVLGEGMSRPLVVPLRPLWSGLVANVVLLGSVAWALLSLPGAAERWVRRRRGLCGQCGYELAGAIRCPECGSE